MQGGEVKPSARRTRPYSYTDHATAVAYAKKGWKGGSRDAWYSHLRSKEKQELPKEAK
jgi:hypothetical protein